MRPEELIRRYLDEHGGAVDADVDHLLVSFDVDELTPEAKTNIASALSDAGVRPEPPLEEVGPDGRLSLRLANGTPEPAADPAQPARWGRSLAGLLRGNGHGRGGASGAEEAPQPAQAAAGGPDGQGPAPGASTPAAGGEG